MTNFLAYEILVRWIYRQETVTQSLRYPNFDICSITGIDHFLYLNIAIYIYIYIYIYSHPQTVSLYHNSSARLDKLVASSWDWNPADFMSVRYLTPELSSFSALVKECFTQNLFTYKLSATGRRAIAFQLIWLAANSRQDFSTQGWGHYFR